MKPIDIKSKKFGRLTAVEYDKDSIKTGHARWIVLCTCGNRKSVRASHLRSGNVRSCGCLARHVSSIALKKYASGPRHKGAGNPQWKGNKAKHAAIHTWLNKHFVKYKCEVCGTGRSLDWALKKECAHDHIKENYRVLCRRHHIHYDRGALRQKQDFNEKLYVLAEDLAIEEVNFIEQEKV